MLQGLYQKGKWLQISHSKSKTISACHIYTSSREGEEKHGFGWQNGKNWWVGAVIEIKISHSRSKTIWAFNLYALMEGEKKMALVDNYWNWN